MPLKIEIWSDYVCPFCLLAKKVLDQATEDKDVEITWHPYELRPEPTPTLLVEGDYLQTIWKSVVYPMAARMESPIVLPDVSPQPYSRLAFEGYQFALEHGKGTEYNERLLTAFFIEERDIGDVEVLTELAAGLGLDAGQYRTALQTGRYYETHQRIQRHAHEDLGIKTVPTIFIGEGRTKVEGMPQRSFLTKVVDEVLAAEQLAAEHPATEQQPAAEHPAAVPLPVA
ncbi:DsbA family protein [Streptomyces sp. ISL-98]|uniref:DsbA family oxidoreductase n=1 Tax=Streptomyces sp. ISL-98 TaxID=2819192 RepID=UPI001BEA00B4|nr:DsbA family protein [Streptomyces sp. ISL-98]MBT2507195.1 DsbA family protein [Streptomyces sp. ISL-98]